MGFNIVITGVGGQGSVLASRILADTAIRAGLAARTSETIGMAQREGSVISHVRMGDSVKGALIPDGQADIILSLEYAETLRAIQKLKPGGLLLINSAKIIPPSVGLKLSVYDDQAIQAYLEKTAARVVLLDANKLALQAGSIKAANVVMLGALSLLPGLPFDPKTLWETIADTLAPKILEINRRAFDSGASALIAASI